MDVYNVGENFKRCNYICIVDLRRYQIEYTRTHAHTHQHTHTPTHTLYEYIGIHLLSQRDILFGLFLFVMHFPNTT